MGILAEDIERVKAATDLVQLASEHIALKRVGTRWQGLCPFHAEKTPSFSVNPEQGFYYCFGCGAGGDVIRFVQEVEHVDFVDAVERLAARAGMQVRHDDAAVSRDRQRRARLVEAMAQAVEWYHQRLLTADDAAAARSYLRSRGYDGEVVRAYRLGWAPDDWDALARALRLPDEVLRDTGLGFVNRAGRVQDSFRGRVMFPIFDARGDAVAFGGRVLPGGEGPKYKNSPETPIYSKSKVLYGLNWAKAQVVEVGEVVVCEGYTDVIGLARAGVPRAVATCGTALADEHFRLLKNFARRVVLAYDADAAGQAAAERFYEWERRYEVDIAVADLPAGADPGELATRDPDGLRAAVEQATPFLAFRLERALRAASLSSPEGRARAAESALAVIREHPSELVRDQYVMQVADRCRIDADRLRAAMARSGTLAAARPAPRARPAGTERTGPEVEALKAAIHVPDAVAGRLDEALFTDDLHAAAFSALAAAANLHEAVERAGPEAGALLQRLAVEEFDADPDDVVALVVRLAAERVVDELKRDGDPQGLIGWLRPHIEELLSFESRLDAVDILLPWLVDRLKVEG